MYDRFEFRAAYLMGGWANVMGQTPDDLAQVALNTYVGLLDEHGPDSAHKMASHGLRQDVTNLYQKDANNPTEYFPEPDQEDPDAETYESQLADIEASWLYFTPDLMDRLSGVLTAREIDAVVHVFESDLTQEETARKMRVSERRVRALLHSALDKARLLWPASQS